jgi:hypothetical protein
MKPLRFLLILVLLLPACGTVTSASDLGCADAVDGLRALTAGLEIPENLLIETAVKTGTEFDPNAYFDVLTHLSMQPGYVLDFVYTYDWMGGYPTLLARPEDEAPFLEWSDVPEEARNYLDHIVVDGTPEGFLQFALLELLGQQFYLFWHANYNDWAIVCNRANVRTIVDGLSADDFGLPMPLADRLKALSLRGLEPVVEIGAQTVEIRFVAFTSWGGFIEFRYEILGAFPHTIQNVNQNVLVPYECGVMF